MVVVLPNSLGQSVVRREAIVRRRKCKSGLHLTPFGGGGDWNESRRDAIRRGDGGPLPLHKFCARFLAPSSECQTFCPAAADRDRLDFSLFSISRNKTRSEEKICRNGCHFRNKIDEQNHHLRACRPSLTFQKFHRKVFLLMWLSSPRRSTNVCVAICSPTNHSSSSSPVAICSSSDSPTHLVGMEWTHSV